MINNFLGIATNPDSITRSNSGNTMGELFFITEMGSFPDNNWYDNMMTLLSWWLQSLISFQNPKIKTAKLRFMEGSFEVDVERIDSTTVCLNLLSGSTTVLDCCFCDKEFLIFNICEVTKTLLGKAYSMQWFDEGFVFLKNTLNHLMFYK
ncbi:MAG: hypothetical protein LBR54_01660 [Oscillospiraceae bacterium]|jgi:hypothetical protein|nr:hypothetical protein [Oscillospiraceae bacterium]